MSKGEEDWKVVAAPGDIEHLPVQVRSQLWRARSHADDSPGPRGKVEVRCISRVQDGQPLAFEKGGQKSTSDICRASP